MRILIIGGSVFLGRAIAAEAVARGHEVTVFNRGKSGTDLEGVEGVRGDRESAEDVAALVAGRWWDAVIDTSGQVPRVVGQSARALAPHADSYLFISSIHAYSGWPGGEVSEESARHECPPDADRDDVPGNALKAGCERAVEDLFPGRTLILNPGLIIGPGDEIGRLPWWLARIARGGTVLAPGNPDRPIQLVDARDIATFALDRLVAEDSGRYFVSGMFGNATFGSMLRECVAVTGSDARLEWVDDAFLTAHEAGWWTELPMWIPEEPDGSGPWLATSAKALAAGFACRPVPATIRDTWEGLRDEVWTPKYLQGDVPVGMAAEKEARIIEAWLSR
jgi:2'-hydroxyisoflavone reductase